MSKATAVQLAVYHVTNNIKRNVGAFMASFINTNDALASIYSSVAPSGVYPYTPPAGNKALIVSVSAPIQVTIVFDFNNETITQTVNSLLVLDTEVTSIEFNNASGSPVDIAIISG